MHTYPFILAAFFSAVATATSATFVDWTTADFSAESATGLLETASVTLTTDQAISGPGGIGNGGLTSATLDSTSSEFASTYFSPNIALTDSISLGTASSFTIQFSQPVLNPVLHLAQLGPNTLNFFNGSGPISFSLLSSDGDFTVTSTTIRGTGAGVSPDDANGSLLFLGSFTEIRWASDSSNNGDGMAIQVSTIPEPSTALFCAIGILGIAFRRIRNARNV